MIYTIITVMLSAFAMTSILGLVVTTLMLKGRTYTAALIVVAYFISGLGMVIYALA